MIGQAREGIGEPDLGIDAVQFGRLDQGVSDGGGLAAGFGADEEIILPPEGQFPFILPMSAKFIGFIINGMPILART